MDPKDDAAKKAAEDAKKAQGDKGEAQVDPKIAELMKDPDAVQTLLKSKRDANEEAKGYRLKLEKIEKDKRDAEEANLKEQGKFKELSEQAKAEAATQRATFTKRLVDMELRIEALNAGCHDPDAAVALADRASVKVSDDLSSVTGAKEAIAALKASKAYLFGTPDKGTPAPGTTPPAPRAGFGKLPPGEAKAHEDLSAGFSRPAK
jgi:hypothetical protein